MRGVVLGCLLVWLLLVILALVGCVCPPQQYKPIPTWLVPGQPTIPTVLADELTCLSDDAYLRLAERDRMCWQHVRELRAILGTAP